ncbi:hypothetical protein HDU97_008217 [Phlyctochytrium planicorne]|nr:hypothetical protein HDU97_008217 [Phlyctochytrium planicorne]
MHVMPSFPSARVKHFDQELELFQKFEHWRSSSPLDPSRHPRDGCEDSVSTTSRTVSLQKLSSRKCVVKATPRPVTTAAVAADEKVRLFDEFIAKRLQEHRNNENEDLIWNMDEVPVGMVYNRTVHWRGDKNVVIRTARGEKLVVLTCSQSGIKARPLIIFRGSEQGTIAKQLKNAGINVDVCVNSKGFMNGTTMKARDHWLPSFCEDANSKSCELDSHNQGNNDLIRTGADGSGSNDAAPKTTERLNRRVLVDPFKLTRIQGGY